MPYGVDKSIGGDSKENDSWMERCVSGISGTNKRTGKPYTKGEKIAICKAQLKKSKSELGDTQSTQVDEDIFERFSQYKEQYIRKSMDSLKVDLATAEAMFDVHLARKNLIIF